MKKSYLKLLCEKTNKKNCIIVYSGTLAIESALIALGIKPKDAVLVASSVCYSIINSIIRIGAIPIIVEPANHFTLTYDEVKDVIYKERIKCIIMVHQYGLGQDIKAIKKAFPTIPIIEDIAQAWNIHIKNQRIGEYSDIVITSFGKTKPLSYGHGGAVLSNLDIAAYMDFYDNDSRNNKQNMLPYYLVDNNKINFKKLIRKADHIVKYQQKVAGQLTFLNNYDFIEVVSEQSNGYVWHRYPILIDENYLNMFMDLLDKCSVKYQLPHPIELKDLPLLENKKFKYIRKDNKENKKIIYIRTRGNKIKNINKLKKIMKGIDKNESFVCNA